MKTDNELKKGKKESKQMERRNNNNKKVRKTERHEGRENRLKERKQDGQTDRRKGMKSAARTNVLKQRDSHQSFPDPFPKGHEIRYIFRVGLICGNYFVINNNFSHIYRLGKTD